MESAGAEALVNVVEPEAEALAAAMGFRHDICAGACAGARIVAADGMSIARDAPALASAPAPLPERPFAPEVAPPTPAPLAREIARATGRAEPPSALRINIGRPDAATGKPASGVGSASFEDNSFASGRPEAPRVEAPGLAAALRCSDSRFNVALLSATRWMTPPPSVIRRIGANVIDAFATLGIAGALDADPDPDAASDAGPCACARDECDAPFNPATRPPACIGTEAMRAVRSPTEIADAKSLSAGDGSLDAASEGDSSTRGDCARTRPTALGVAGAAACPRCISRPTIDALGVGAAKR